VNFNHAARGPFLHGPGDFPRSTRHLKSRHRKKINKSFSGVQGAVFQKSPLVAEGILNKEEKA